MLIKLAGAEKVKTLTQDFCILNFPFCKWPIYSFVLEPSVLLNSTYIKKENNLLVGTFDILIPQLTLNPEVKCIVLLSIILSEKTGMHAQPKSTINKILINNNNSSTIIILTNIV